MSHDPNEQFFASFGAVASFGAARAAANYAALPMMSGAARHVSAGARVDAWRRDLNSLGGKYASAGSAWDAGLTSATKQFQQDQGLSDDGIVGPNTLTAMQAARQAQGQSQSSSNIAASNTPQAGIETVSHSSGGGSSAASTSTGGGDSTALAVTTPFLEMEAWEGGPTRGTALGIGAAVVGLLGVIGALVTMRPSGEAPMQPAAGFANRRH
jgi:peptidoglycan hydrolase-like protein with peptidoglycan-binding domain